MSDFDFRTEFFRLRLPLYKVASAVSLHPSRLSLFLNGRLPIPSELRTRLIGVLKEYGAPGPDR